MGARRTKGRGTRAVGKRELWARGTPRPVTWFRKERTEVAVDVQGLAADDLARPLAHLCGTQSPAAKDNALGIAGASSVTELQKA